MHDLEHLSFKPDKTGSCFEIVGSRSISKSLHTTNGNAVGSEGKAINISA